MYVNVMGIDQDTTIDLQSTPRWILFTVPPFVVLLLAIALAVSSEISLVLGAIIAPIAGLGWVPAANFADALCYRSFDFEEHGFPLGLKIAHVGHFTGYISLTLLVFVLISVRFSDAQLEPLVWVTVGVGATTLGTYLVTFVFVASDLKKRR